MIPRKPVKCYNCDGTDFWLRTAWEPPEWLCNRCHPNPNKEVEVPTEEAPTKTQAHIQYKLKDGTIVPGVTTVLKILNKPDLIDWAWRCGREGIDYREVRDNASDIGTLAHYLITCHLKGEVPDTSEYSSEQMEKAKNCLAKYVRWEKKHALTPVMMETPLVSEEFRYGGTLDLLAELDGEFALIDFKTGRSFYPDMLYQLAAYWKLLEEQGWPVSSARILRIGTDEDEDFEESVSTSLDNEWQIFTHCLEIYRLQKSR